MQKLIAILALIVVTSYLHAQDVSGSEDHTIISRYPGAEIKFYYQQQYAELELPQAVKESKPADQISAKGKHTSILYAAPKGVSVLEIFRNYEQAVKQADAEVLFTCRGKYAPDGCDDYNTYYALSFFNENYYEKRYNNTDQYILLSGSDDQAMIVAVFEDVEKRIYMEVGINGNAFGAQAGIQLEVIEEEKMKDGLITAESFEEEMAKHGKIALYGILFETGKSELKPSSMHELTLIQQYLEKHPAVNVYVVGHTDDTGNMNSNIELSNQRAKAVLDHLISKGINDGRMIAHGAGPFAPVSTNESDNGKKLNRRVEIVKRLK